MMTQRVPSARVTSTLSINNEDLAQGRGDAQEGGPVEGISRHHLSYKHDSPIEDNSAIQQLSHDMSNCCPLSTGESEHSSVHAYATSEVKSRPCATTVSEQNMEDHLYKGSSPRGSNLCGSPVSKNFPSVFLHRDVASIRPQIPHELPSNKMLALPLNSSVLGTILKSEGKASKRTNAQLCHSESYYSHPGMVSSSSYDIRKKIKFASAAGNIVVDSSQNDPKFQSMQQRKKRFLRTREALEKSGLLEVTMRTASLIKQNQILNHDIQELKHSTKCLLAVILNNPENQSVKDYILSQYNGDAS